MHGLLETTLRLIDRISPPAKVSAHCDIPCGIYDPHLAQVAALTVVRMHQQIAALEAPGPGGSKDDRDKYLNSLSRYVATKEHHAELCKHEVRIIWGDWFKAEHLEKHADLHNIVWNIMKLGSKVRQNIDAAAADQLVAEVQKFAEIFWATKDTQVRKIATKQAVGGEYVVPA